jgi:nucleoside-diphosphate-sugar epimerase
MNILLTGGTGFIGSHFLQQAIASGHSVLALRRSSTSTPRISICEPPHWLNRKLDEVSEDDLKGCDVLVHLAAHSVNPPYDSLSSCLYWNLMAVQALLEQAHIAGIRRFIIVGSCFEYGRSGERYEAIPTDAPLEPTNSYAVSKAAASIAACQWAEEHKLSLEILRVFHVFGEGELETRLWPSLRRAALLGDDLSMTAGEQIRDFTAVEDVAATILERATLTLTSVPGVHVFNIGSGRPSSIRFFAQNLWNHWEAKGSLNFGSLPYRRNEVMRYVAGPALIRAGKADLKIIY